jgi:hypothetical protein
VWRSYRQEIPGKNTDRWKTFTTDKLKGKMKENIEAKRKVFYQNFGNHIS